MTMRYRAEALLAGAVLLAAIPLQAQAPDRLYGQVRTASGAVHEGYIRWDRNEAGWFDLLNGSRDLDPDILALVQDADEASRARSVEFLGVRISWNEDPEGLTTAEAGIRFGHVRSLRVTGDDRALLELRSGREVELFGGSTDLGDDLRDLVVDVPGQSPVELAWRDLDRVTFMDPPAGTQAPSSARLYGTVEDRWGNRWEGYVAWDTDEVLGSDVLDGRRGGRDHEIPFREIRGIERASASSARVFLVDGSELELTGSNDVGPGHRGVQISDPGLGQVDVPWREFRSVRFHEPSAGLQGVAAFDGGVRLHGTVETEDGASFTGPLIWDADEAWSWEILDGQWRGLVFDVEFGQIASIRKRSSRSAEVTLRDGRSFELEGSNDVNGENKGMVVEVEGGEPLVIPWDRFRKVTFHRP